MGGVPSGGYSPQTPGRSEVPPERSRCRPNRLERFEREAQVVAARNHPNIVTVHAIERDEGAPFMAMEYLDGKDARRGHPPRRAAPRMISPTWRTRFAASGCSAAIAVSCGPR